MEYLFLGILPVCEPFRGLQTLCWACADVRRLPAALLAEGASLASYCVYLRLKYNYVLHLGGRTFVMGLEALAMLAALAFALWVLAGRVRDKHREGKRI